MPKPEFIPYLSPLACSAEEAELRTQHFLKQMASRRTVRAFSQIPVPDAVIKDCIKTAGTAPSGANLQPWFFSAVSDIMIKRQIRISAEEEERAFYEGRAPAEWLETLAPLGTDANKPFLEEASHLIVIWARKHDESAGGKKRKHYYVQESVGIAAGMLITALHLAGVATLTHTPSPMGFLNEILNRPKTDKPFLLLVAGYPAPDAEVPNINRKDLTEIAEFIDDPNRS